MELLEQRLVCIERCVRQARYDNGLAPPQQQHRLERLEQHVQRVLASVDTFATHHAALRGQKRAIKQRSNALLDALSSAKATHRALVEVPSVEAPPHQRAMSWHSAHACSLARSEVFEGVAQSGLGLGLRAAELAMEEGQGQAREGRSDAEWVLVDEREGVEVATPGHGAPPLAHLSPAEAGAWVKGLGVSERLPRSLVKNGVGGRQLVALVGDMAAGAEFRRRFRLSLGALAKLLWEIDTRDRQERSPRAASRVRTV